MSVFSAKNLAVGYNGKALIKDINIELDEGSILCLIGPNGAGKSTILKTITREIPAIGGNMYIEGMDISRLSRKTIARSMAVVLTERIHPEMMTSSEIVAMGRYPYTGMFGRLTDRDRTIVNDALEQVHALDLAGQYFSTLSDGQKQRIMLARAICQEPEILILDEPTAFLDIRYKIELLDILREMARAKKTAILMSLHEVDLAMKISDQIICLDGDKITAAGTPEAVIEDLSIEKLYNIQKGSYNLLFGSIELPKPDGEPIVFVTAGNGRGTPWYRALQKKGIPFATGILFENDADCQTADALSSSVIKSPAFEPVSDETFSKAADILLKCNYILDTGASEGMLNHFNSDLLKIAEQNHIPIVREIRGINEYN